MTSSYPCTLCCRPTTMWCSRCQRAWYCSAQHLETDWPRHRRECLTSNTVTPAPYQLVAGTLSMVPQLVTVTGLLFSPEQERPHVVTVHCQPAQLPQQGVCPTPLVQDFFTDSQPQSVVLTQGLNGDSLRFPLHLFYCPISLARGAPVNRAIYRITSGAAPKAWCGPVLVLKFNGSRKQGYSDASTNDLPALSAYFLNYK